MIISASRRTDIPAFFGDWLMERIKEGHVIVKNPFNPQQQKNISLQLPDVTIFVFWTKNAIPFMSQLETIHNIGYPFYFLHTITPYGVDLEKNLPVKGVIVDNFKRIIDLYGPKRAIWRYDPIIITKKYDIDYHIRAFTKLTGLLEGYADICLFSFLEYYHKLKNRRWPEGFIPVPEETTKISLLAKLGNVAASRGIELAACCNGFEGISQPGCINPHFTQGVGANLLKINRDKHQRENCHCIKSIDIGTYNTCRHGCLYCYAC